jgi:hypothetical protein
MRLNAFLAVVLLLGLAVGHAQAHEQKTLTVIVNDTGAINGNVSDAAFVQGNALWFRMEDTRTNASIIIQFDTDMDGTYNASVDYTSSQLTNTCELDENGSKVDEECFTSTTYVVPANATVGNHTYWIVQSFNGTNTTRMYSVVVHEDVHVEDGPTAGDCFGVGCEDENEAPTTESGVQGDSDVDTEDLIVVLALLATVGTVALSASILQERQAPKAYPSAIEEE